ncbi:MAG TPA: right-handed parallel beta-helix repeat-containing protein [Acidimicrobiales bacterium]|nr:right-handed parallel beta-helix repeat-containing protein [Acidimicrobiales bacterium]
MKTTSARRLAVVAALCVAASVLSPAGGASSADPGAARVDAAAAIVALSSASRVEPAPTAAADVPIIGSALAITASSDGRTATSPAPAPAPGPAPAPAPSVQGASYYVDSVAGNDAASGTSPSAPWRTLGKVNATSFSPGDVIHFKRGSTWTGQQLVIDSNGTSAAPVTYRAYGTGTAPTFRNAAYGTAVKVTGNWNVVRELRLIENAYTGVEIFGSRNVASDNQITTSGSGMWLKGPDNLATRNDVRDLRMYVNTVGGDDDYGAVGFWVSAANNEVSYNRCTNCKAPSHDYGYDGGFVEVWQVGDGLHVHHNVAIDTDGFIEVGGRGAGASAVDMRLSYNLLVRTGISMCLHHDWMPIDRVTFDNNTLIGPNRIACVSPSYPGFRSTIITMRNNIFSGNGTIATFPFTHVNNLYTANPGFTLSAGERIADPRFRNPGAGDYRLQATSPAVDAGINVGYATDLDGNPVSPPPDLGAYELQR